MTRKSEESAAQLLQQERQRSSNLIDQMSRERNLYEQKIREIEEERDKLRERVTSYSLFQILSQSGILRNLKVEEEGLRLLLQKIVNAELPGLMEHDAPRPRKTTSRNNFPKSVS